MHRQRLHSRLGCEACKIRKKKCDEQKPVCGSCRRLHFTCEWQQFRVDGAKLGSHVSGSRASAPVRPPLIRPRAIPRQPRIKIASTELDTLGYMHQMTVPVLAQCQPRIAWAELLGYATQDSSFRALAVALSSQQRQLCRRSMSDPTEVSSLSYDIALTRWREKLSTFDMSDAFELVLGGIILLITETIRPECSRESSLVHLRFALRVVNHVIKHEPQRLPQISSFLGLLASICVNAKLYHLANNTGCDVSDIKILKDVSALPSFDQDWQLQLCMARMDDLRIVDDHIPQQSAGPSAKHLRARMLASRQQPQRPGCEICPPNVYAAGIFRDTINNGIDGDVAVDGQSPFEEIIALNAQWLESVQSAVPQSLQGGAFSVGTCGVMLSAGVASKTKSIDLRRQALTLVQGAPRYECFWSADEILRDYVNRGVVASVVHPPGGD